MVPPEIEAKILRLHHAEKWPVGTIAAQLQIHPDVVIRVLDQSGVPQPTAARKSILDDYVPFIKETP